MQQSDQAFFPVRRSAKLVGMALSFFQGWGNREQIGTLEKNQEFLHAYGCYTEPWIPQENCQQSSVGHHYRSHLVDLGEGWYHGRVQHAKITCANRASKEVNWSEVATPRTSGPPEPTTYP